MIKLRDAKNEHNIPRIMGSLALAPYSKLSWTIYLALDRAIYFL